MSPSRITDRRARSTLRITLFGTVLLLAGSSSAPALEPPEDFIAMGLRDLHRGLYGRAEESFRAAADSSPGDPEPLFLISFSRWWRILIERSGRPYDDPVFDRAAESAIVEGQRRLAVDDEDVRGMAAAGGAYMLRSHVEALRKNYFRGAREARSGKRLLEAALQRDPDLEMALFTLGAFNYFADHVPLIVKGIRAFLFLPGGDADLGLQQIRKVARTGGLFRTDARLLLARICGSPEEVHYEDAFGHLERAHEENPDSPVILAAMGDLRLRLGRYTEAEEYFARGLEFATGDEAERSRQRELLLLARAEANLADWRLERGEELLERVPEESATSSPAHNRVRRRLLSELAAKREGGETIERFLEGRRLFRAERFPEALNALGGVAIDDRSPPWLAGWVELYSGLAQARMGNEWQARVHLKRASRVRRFRAAERALLELDDGRTGNPLCAP